MARISGFTLIELVLIVAIAGILATVVTPKLQLMNVEAKTAACKYGLNSLREGISTWRLARIASTGSTFWPAIDTLRTVQSVMMHQIPPNPFQLADRAPDSIVTGVTKGTIVGTRGGWAYKPSTGEIWPNTSSTSGGSGCSGGTPVGENNW